MDSELAAPGEPSSSSISPPPWLDKKRRAELAKETISYGVPKLLRENERARNGNARARLIPYSPSQDPAVRTSASLSSTTAAVSSSVSEKPCKIRVIQSDTFDAAQAFTKTPLPRNSRVGVLSMASALRPGGGVLNGAQAQEESLCMRSTLYASLREDFYRIPELSAIYSPDVLVFRPSGSLLSHLYSKADRFYVDVISCAALRCPDVDDVDEDDGDGGGKRKKKVYAEERDRETMTLKIRLILQVARENKITHLVLGALGCGAYKNPPVEVAKIFKRAICGDKRRAGGASGIQEIVFAIFDDGENLRVFRDVFQDGLSDT